MNGNAAAALLQAETWIFDLDNTLYPASCNLFAQVDKHIGDFIARLLNVDAAEAYRIQKQYFRDYGTSLRGLMVHHQVDPLTFLEFVHAVDVSPVQPSPALDRALGRLPGRKIVFTNGSTKHAENVMARLGVSRHFDAIFDIVAADYFPKPEPFVYDRLVRRHWIDPKRAVMIEDIAKNLLPAHQMGMTTVLVRTEAEWARDGVDGAHVHHVTDDLVAWLVAIAAVPALENAIDPGAASVDTSPGVASWSGPRRKA
jgi:putative hydrolase of the HAD superfamily